MEEVLACLLLEYNVGLHDMDNTSYLGYAKYFNIYAIHDTTVHVSKLIFDLQQWKEN